MVGRMAVSGIERGAWKVHECSVVGIGNVHNWAIAEGQFHAG